MQTNPEQCFLLVKRGLYYAPNNQGYTGVKDRAGRYREVDALGLDGVTAIHEDKAPLFAPACWQETKAAFYEEKIAAFAEREARHHRTMQDHGRMLWRDDVEGHCLSPDLCFDYSDAVRCSPCAIKQSKAAGVDVRNPDNSYSPEVCRLKREVAQQAEREARLVGALELVGKILPSAAGLDDAPNSKPIPFYINMGELRAIKATLAALKDRTHG